MSKTKINNQPEARYDQEVFYRKVGGRYKPVAQYDASVCDSFPKGTHLVQCYPGGTLRRFNVDPKVAPMLAAARLAEERMANRLVEISELRTRREKITVEQKQAWENLAKAFGEEMFTLEVPSAREVAGAGVNAMIEQAQEFLEDPMCLAAYQEFEATCKLVLERKNK